jgi:hypothetical protein
MSPAHAVLKLQSLLRALPLSIDIEGGVDGLRCISFSQDPGSGFVVPWDVYTLEEQCLVAPALAQVLGDESIPKVLQNSLYDNFVLTKVYAMPIRGILHDTMLSSWEIYPELPKSLAVQASIWTLEPYWKGDKGAEDRRTLWRYCCLDSAVTLEISRAHAGALAQPSARLSHYRRNVDLLAPCLYMQLRGIAYDAEAAALEHIETVREMAAYQGAIEETADAPINLHSAKQLCKVLYKTLGYPPQHPRVGRKVDLTRWTADAEALAALQRLRPADPFLSNIVEWKNLDRLREALLAQPDADGRMRSGFNVVGDEAGRIKTYASPSGTEADISLLPRNLFKADPGQLLFECSLVKPREWSLAAHYRRLGDESLWNALVSGAQVPPFINRSTEAVYRQWVKDQLLAKGTLESASGQLRTFFGRRDAASTLADAISHEPTANSAYALKLALLRLWTDPDNRCPHQQLSSLCRTSPVHLPQVCGEGHEIPHAPAEGIFADRAHGDPDPDRPAAHHDERRCGRPADVQAGNSRGDLPDSALESLIVEPLHARGDGFLVQGPAERRDWAVAKLREWFSNPLTIAGFEVVIPVEVRCGPNWGEMEVCP